jgi:hypothetical protein
MDGPSPSTVLGQQHHIEVASLEFIPSFNEANALAFSYPKYSKSSRAKCHSSRCGGSLISQGELRYGHTVRNSYSEICSGNTGELLPYPPTGTRLSGHYGCSTSHPRLQNGPLLLASHRHSYLALLSIL